VGVRLGRWRAIAGIVALTAGVVVGVVALPAGAGVGLGVTIGFPSAATVGQTGLTGSLGVTNTSDGQQSGGTVTLTSLSLVPSCATAARACGVGADPGVFGVGTRAQGGAGTACSGPADGPGPVGGVAWVTPRACVLLRHTRCNTLFSFRISPAIGDLWAGGY